MKKYLRRLIGEGKTNQVLEHLKAITDEITDKDLKNEIAMLSSRFKRNERGKHLDVTDLNQQDLSDNKINRALLILIDKLPDDLELSKIIETKLPSSSQEKNTSILWKLLGGIVLILVLFLGIRKVTEVNLSNSSQETERSSSTEIIESEGDNSPAIKSNGNVKVNYGNTKTESSKEKQPKAEQENTNKEPLNSDLRVKTKGNQSPAVVGEEVNISFGGSEDKQKDPTENNN